MQISYIKCCCLGRSVVIIVVWKESLIYRIGELPTKHEFTKLIKQLFVETRVHFRKREEDFVTKFSERKARFVKNLVEISKRDIKIQIIRYKIIRRSKQRFRRFP